MSRIVAELLRQKAQGDFSAAVVLANAEPRMDDETVGLHLQQAVEKAAKAMLADRGTPFATQARHERVIPAGSFDRTAFVALVRDFLAWTNRPG